MARDGTGTVSAPSPSSRTLARSVGALCTAGATLEILRAAVHDGPRDHLVLTGAVGILVIGVLLGVGLGDHLPRQRFHLVLLGIELVIGAGYAVGGDPASDLRLFFVWTVPVACCFLLPREALHHVLLVGALLAVALAVHQSTWSAGLASWIGTFTTVVAVGAFTGGIAAMVRHREEALERAAHVDPTTGLPNRRAFGRLTTDVLARREAHGGTAVLFLADLDRFKTLNDAQGHVVGDEVLADLAAELRRVAPPGSLVARLGSDEFAVLVDDPSGYLDVQALLDGLAVAWQRPIATGDRGPVHVSACVGVTRSGHGDTASSLLRDAEAALLRAKRGGPGSSHVFRPEHRTDQRRRYAVEQGLHQAGERAEFHLVFQPVVEITTGRLRAAETLLRWTSPTLGEVSPAEFIPVAEDNGLVVPIGTWVLEHAIAQLGAWLAAGIVPADFHLSINVSGLQVDESLPRRIAALLDEHGVAPEMVMIELTETVLISANAETTDALTALRDLGLLLVLDDFGTGFSSLSHLQQGQFDAVKIDRSFVRGCGAPRCGPVDRHRDPRARRGARHRRRGRGCGVQGTGRRAPRPRLPVGAGLPVRPSAGARRARRADVAAGAAVGDRRPAHHARWCGAAAGRPDRRHAVR
jgi:diguanylate cyclase (GGDEF)-like protein